jgi:hypothetical protein
MSSKLSPKLSVEHKNQIFFVKICPLTVAVRALIVSSIIFGALFVYVCKILVGTRDFFSISSCKNNNDDQCACSSLYFYSLLRLLCSFVCWNMINLFQVHLTHETVAFVVLPGLLAFIGGIFCVCECGAVGMTRILLVYYLYIRNTVPLFFQHTQ